MPLLCDKRVARKPHAAVRADLIPQATATGSWGRTDTEGAEGADHTVAGHAKAPTTPSLSSPLPPSPQQSTVSQVAAERDRERERERESLSMRAIRLSQSLRSERLRAVDLHKMDGSEQPSAAPEPPLQALDALPLLTRGGVHLRRQDPEPQGPEQRLESDNEALSERVVLGAVPESSLSFLDLDFSTSSSSSSPSSTSSSPARNSLAAGAATALVATATTTTSDSSSTRTGPGYSSGVPGKGVLGGASHQMNQESNPSLRLLAAAQGPNAVQWLRASNGQSPSSSSTSPTAAGVYGAPTPFARSRTPAPGTPSASAARAVTPGLAIVPEGDVDEANAANAVPAFSSVATGSMASVNSEATLDSDVGVVVEDMQGFAGLGTGEGGQRDSTVAVTATVADRSATVSSGHSPGLRKTVTKGAVTWVKLVRTLPGQEDITTEEKEGEGQNGEGEGEGEGEVFSGEGPGTAAVSAEHKAPRQLRGGEEAQKKGPGGSTRGVKAPSASTSRARAQLLGGDLAAQEAGEAGEGGGPGVQVSAGDLDTVLGRLEIKYEVTDEALVEGNVRTLMELGARGGQVMRVVAKQPGLLSRSIGEEAGALVGVLDAYEIRRTALLQGLGKSLDCLAVGAEQADGVLGFLDKQMGVNNLGKVISTMPHVLGQTLEELASTVALLKELDVPDIGAALERNPALLGRGAADVREKVEALEALVGRRAVRSMVHRCAPLMLASPEDITDTFSRLLKLVGESEAIHIVTAQPQVSGDAFCPWVASFK